MNNKKIKKAKDKHKFIIEREYSGNKTMTEAFEEIIEEQTNCRFEKWIDNNKKSAM